MKIDLTRVPFSSPRGYLCISDITRETWGIVWGVRSLFKEEGLYLRTGRGGPRASGGGYARLEALQDGKKVEYTYEASPWEVTLRAGAGCVRISVDRCGQMRFKGEGLGLALRLLPGTFDEFLTYSPDSRYIAAFRYDSKLMITRLRGEAVFDDPGLEARDKEKTVTMAGGDWELLVDEFAVVYDEKPRSASFDACVEAAKQEFEAYAQKGMGGPERYQEAVRQALYVNYSAQVPQDGLLEGRVMLMSKNWMNSVWTWDCQFNAVELCGYDPEAAWDNFASPFRRQYKTGMLLDMISANSFSDTYTKPPVHGWALARLREKGILSRVQKAWAYERLLSWVNAWYTYMDWDRDGICQYNHGNDSGWDNCTYFLCGAPIEGPDLSAYLVLCWDELEELARELDMPEAACEHRRRADKQLEDLLRHSWDGEKFHVYQSGTHNEKTDCDSLLPFLPIILGDRLPKDIFQKLATGLKQENRFLTPYGLATESVSSALYVPDGYWRGPIWAPPMMFIIYGLAKGGEVDFAAELAERFCANCAREGFAENFDAKEGRGLRDRAYTWCSSVFLILAKNYLK